MMLGKKKTSPCLVHSLLIIAVRVRKMRHSTDLLGSCKRQFRITDALSNALHDLRTPHKGSADIFLRESVILRHDIACHLFKIFGPCHILRRHAAFRMYAFKPWSHSPARILVAHTHNMPEAGIPACLYIFRRVRIGYCRPDIVTKPLNIMARRCKD